MRRTVVSMITALAILAGLALPLAAQEGAIISGDKYNRDQFTVVPGGTLHPNGSCPGGDSLHAANFAGVIDQTGMNSVASPPN